MDERGTAAMDPAAALIPAVPGEETEAAELQWEYVPGHRWVDRDGGEHWFVQSGVIKPSYVKTYMEEGGEVLRRRVGPWEEVDASTPELPPKEASD